MSRVACTVCGLEILPVTAERNQGLCGRCAKGDRPCIYCGRHVSEPLPDGVYAHVECSIRNRQIRESLNWRTADDIDWEMVRQRLHTMLRKLLDRVVVQHVGTAPVKLRFYVHVEDFIDILVHEIQPDGSVKRLSNGDWDQALSPLDSSFSLLHEKLSEEEAVAASGHVTRSLTGILSDECKELEKHNFKYAPSIPVTWVVQGA